jgi:uncharacterized protein
MGYVDADTHVRETDKTWSYLSIDEQQYRPLSMVAEQGPMGSNASTHSPDISRYWVIQDQRIPRKDGSSARPRERELFGAGTVEMEDVSSRLAQMDALGIDVQILFPTFWIGVVLSDPSAERALGRSYNRWMADATSSCSKRLRWIAKPFVHDIEASLAELDFVAAHGAVGVWLKGREQGFDLADRHYWPLYERAEHLGLMVAVHTGTDGARHPVRSGAPSLFQSNTTVLDGFYTVMSTDIAERFPGIRWGFFEAGSAWTPWLIQGAIRSDPYLLRDERLSDWQVEAAELLDAKRCYVAAFADDDLTYLTRVLGDRHLVLGSDWGHYDAGSDLACHRAIASNLGLDESSRQRITGDNARALFRIAEDLRPVALAPTTSDHA